MSRNLLAKLTTKGVNLNPIGGTPDITWQDVAFAIAGLDERHHKFVRAVYCEDNSATRQLVSSIASEVEQSYDFVFAALFEFIFPNICKKCNGVGMVGAATCESCAGSSIIRVSDRKRAVLMNRDRKYYKSRERIYDHLLELFNAMDQDVINHMRGKLTQAA